MTDSKPNLDTSPSPPTPSLLRRIENASLEAAAKLLGMRHTPKHERMVRLTQAQHSRLADIEAEAVCNFTGDLNQLEAALGMLRMGPYVGWKVLYILHSKKTVRTYEEILGIRIRDEFEERGPGSYRSLGLAIADKYTNFWKVAGGDIKIPKRRDITN